MTANGPDQHSGTSRAYQPIRFLLLGLSLLVSACISPVEYGKIPHAQYVQDPRCNPESAPSVSTTNLPFFFVTSRLPDCRTPVISLTNHRSDKVRFGRFAGPTTALDAKGKETKITPATITSEAQWWSDLSLQMGAVEGRVMLYVHGYRETFRTSSRDVAQMARLTGFRGPIIQYSWPSQGELLKYAADETNMYWDERNFRKFLMKLAQQDWTKEIIVISHSLGARLVLPAIEYVDRASLSRDSSNISNIILASPDIDRQDFERDIAEEILSLRRVNNNRRITIYASAKDRALSLSADLHGYPRLGSPRCFDPFRAARLEEKDLPKRCYAKLPGELGAPAKSGLTIIDTTAVSRGRTGHSDYLRAAAACLDFAAVVNGERDRRTGREPTHLPHVFTLPPPPKGTKPNNMFICRQASD